MLITNTNNQFKVQRNNRTEYYLYPKMSHLAWTFNNDGNYYVQFTYEDDYLVKFSLAEITNQPTWINNLTGAEQAVNDISTWINTYSSGSLLLLSQILTSLQNFTDYESVFVKDANGVVYQEVRVWDQDSQTWVGAPSYYIPGNTTPQTPVAPISYLDPSSALAAILAELIIHTGLLTNIDSTTTNSYTELLNQGITLDNLETLATTLNSIVATEATLNAVLTELQAINIDTDGLSQEATQLLVLAAINTVISNTTGLSTEVTLAALLSAFNAEDFATETTLQSVLTELQGINLDTNGLSQEATQLLVLAALNNILADTANLDVPLSTVATEVTLQAVLSALTNISASGLATEATLLALLNAFNAEDFATETTLALIEAVTAQMTFTGGDLNVSANMQVGGTDVSGANPVPVTFSGTAHTTSLTRVASSGPGANVPAGAFEVSFFNAGTIDNSVNGAVFKPGERVTYIADVGRTLPSIPYSAGIGSDLVISITI